MVEGEVAVPKDEVLVVLEAVHLEDGHPLVALDQVEHLVHLPPQHHKLLELLGVG